MIDNIRETRTDGAAGSMWDWSWGLMFVCLMTMLSMATQRYSGYVEPHSTEAHTVAPVVASAR
jgi:hypothetical protein